MGNLLWIIFGFLLVVAVVCNMVYFMRRKKKPVTGYQGAHYKHTWAQKTYGHEE